MVAALTMVFESLNVNNFPSFYLNLIKFAPECTVCQDCLSRIHSLPMLPFLLKVAEGANIDITLFFVV